MSKRKTIAEAEDDVLRNFWMVNYVDAKTSLCALCGNTGFVDTTHTAVSAAGTRPGGRFPCICPNGRAIRASRSKGGKS